MLGHLQAHLWGKVVILGIGNTLRSDDGAGSILAARLKNKTSFLALDAGPNPENYLGKIIQEKPDNIVIIDAVDLDISPGEFRVLEAQDVNTTHLFSTHNASIALTINYLQSNLRTDIIILFIQPKSIAFGDNLSSEVSSALDKLEEFFLQAGDEKKG